MALLTPLTVLCILASIVALFTYLEPRLIVRWFSLTRATPGFEYVAFFYAHGWFVIGGLVAIAVFNLVMTWSWWSISYFLIEDGQLEYQLGPFISNQVPLHAIQSKDIKRGILGIIFGFGTLTIDAGRKEETLRYVPDIVNFLHCLNPVSAYR
jgi:uncharacterized membrane protein YdbT with pleckstrin-like domain